MATCIFDAHGQVWDARALERAPALRAALKSQALLRRAMREFGVIAVSEIGSSVRIRLVPAAISPTAFGALCYRLADRNPARVEIAAALPDHGWSTEAFDTLSGALRYLASALPDGRDRADDFMSRPRRIEQCGLGTLEALIQLCREVRRPIPLERLERLLHSGLGSRYVLVQVGDDGAVYFREVGRGFPWFEERWVSQARGLRMQDQPDYYIGRWAAQTYRMVARERAPTLDDIDAITDTPHLGRSRIRYTRLIVPVAAPWGESCLLGACVINPQIDLRAGGSLQ